MAEREGLLSLLGRAEPDDLAGWMEQGGLLALQQARARSPEGLLAWLAPLLAADDAVHVAPGVPPHPHTLIVEELPLWLLAGALIAARAAGRSRARLILGGQTTSAHRALLDDARAGLLRCGLVGPTGWHEGIEIEAGEGHPDCIDAVAALRIALCCARGDAPATTLDVVGDEVVEVPVGAVTENG